MTPKEALAAIMAAIPNTEDFDEHFGVLNESVSGSSGETAGEDWKARYENLRDKYIARFSEMTEEVDTGTSAGSAGEDENEPEVKKIEELDFSAETE